MFLKVFTAVTSVVRKVSNDLHYKSHSHWVNKRGAHYVRVVFDIRTKFGNEDPKSDFQEKVLVFQFSKEGMRLVPDYDPREKGEG